MKGEQVESDNERQRKVNLVGDKKDNLEIKMIAMITEAMKMNHVPQSAPSLCQTLTASTI